MNHTGGWMGGGMVGGIWFWTVIGLLVGIMLYAMIKLLKK
jgi:predicted PurR-regulated permease PerM